LAFNQGGREFVKRNGGITMICRKCNRNQTTGRNRICDLCVSANTRRRRNEPLTIPGLEIGTCWRLNRAPSVIGEIESLHHGGYIHCNIVDDNAEFTWKGTIEEFKRSWRKIDRQSDLDRDVARHVRQTRHDPLPGQQVMHVIVPANEIGENSRGDNI
jgi:hypothetical protein